MDRVGLGQRHKPWREVCAESRQIEHRQLELGGAGTALHMVNAMERKGGDSRSWMDRWLREKGIEKDSRAGHELTTLTGALYHAGSCDQVNLGGLGSIEVLCRHVAVIVEAHVNPNSPN